MRKRLALIALVAVFSILSLVSMAKGSAHSVLAYHICTSAQC
ncbi:MAG TPA: hypothetical protein VKQ72_04260 [Aggregatilineales bacterium]|nr:hypothetical protein [Aggregatilineales bacterium]